MTFLHKSTYWTKCIVLCFMCNKCVPKKKKKKKKERKKKEIYPFQNFVSAIEHNIMIQVYICIVVLSMCLNVRVQPYGRERITTCGCFAGLLRIRNINRNKIREGNATHFLISYYMYFMFSITAYLQFLPYARWPVMIKHVKRFLSNRIKQLIFLSLSYNLI